MKFHQNSPQFFISLNFNEISVNFSEISLTIFSRVNIRTITSQFRKLQYGFHQIVLSYYKLVKETCGMKKVNTIRRSTQSLTLTCFGEQ